MFPQGVLRACGVSMWIWQEGMEKQVPITVGRGPESIHNTYFGPECLDKVPLRGAMWSPTRVNGSALNPEP